MTMSSERSEPTRGFTTQLVKVVKVCFAYVVKPFTGEVVKVCSGPYVDQFVPMELNLME